MSCNPAAWALGSILLLSLATAAYAQAPPAQPGQHPGQLEIRLQMRLQYLLYLPKGYNEDLEKKWPLILFLHGAGERGDNLEKVKIHGPPKILAKGKDLPFIVVSPQCPANSWWEPLPLLALLDAIQANYRVDPDRVYLTGLSMGGFGTWDLAVRNPDRFAAIAPICGAGKPFLAGQLKNVPAWVFHGDSDPVVPVQNSDEMVEALKRVNADVTYTRYRGVGHDSWTATYDNPKLYTWFLSHKRSQKPGRKEAATQPAGR